ncbi:pol polyprotein, partial [Tanacetum coccineum]
MASSMGFREEIQWFKVSRLKVKLACKLCVGAANEESLTSYNEIVIAIRGSLHELRHLELIGNKMSDRGLQVILDGCCHLGTLDLRVHRNQQAFYYLEKAAGELQPDDIYLLGAAYLIGDCAKKDIASSLWRFYRVTAVGLGIVMTTDHLGMLPPDDKMFKFILLLQHSMPTSVLSGTRQNHDGSKLSLIKLYIYQVPYDALRFLKMTNTQTPPPVTIVVNTTSAPVTNTMKLFFHLTTGIARFLKETVPQVEPPAEGQSSNAQDVQATTTAKGIMGVSRKQAAGSSFKGPIPKGIGKEQKEVCQEEQRERTNHGGWWINTGVTSHVCADKSMFHSFRAVDNRQKLYMGNSATVDIKGEGDVVLKRTSEKELKLTNVFKDEAIDKFVLYKNEVENQLGKKIKVVRSDRGGENVFTTPYSPQQNSIAKRKNRTERKWYCHVDCSGYQPGHMGRKVNPSLSEKRYLPQKGNNGEKPFKSEIKSILPKPYVGAHGDLPPWFKMIKSTKDMLKLKFDMKDMGLADNSGYVFTLGGAAISWKFSKQTVIAKSTIESECIALDKCGEKAEWLGQFVEDIPRWPKLIGALHSPRRELRNELKYVQSEVKINKISCLKVRHVENKIWELELSHIAQKGKMTNTQTPPHATTVVIPTGAPATNKVANHAERPEKFNGQNFKRWQQKMFFYLTTLGLARFLKETVPEVEPPVEDPLYNMYCKTTTVKELWESLERKYKTEDAGTKKFVVLIHDIHAEGMTLSETFQAAAIIEKLPPSWVDFKNYLKHKRKEMSVEDLVVHHRIEEDNRSNPKGKGKDKRKNDKKSKGKSEYLAPKAEIVNLVGTNHGGWWIDTGATRHVCADKSMFHYFRAVDNRQKLYMGNYVTTDIKGEGDVVLKMTAEKELKLTNVLYVPEI